MTHLLDASVCIACLRGKASGALRRQIESSDRSEACVCSIVQAELWYGLERSNQPERHRDRLVTFLVQFDSLPFDDGCALEYAKARIGLEQKGLRSATATR